MGPWQRESTLRSLIDAGRSSKRLDELSSARVIGKIAQQIHAAQQKAGQGKAVGPITPFTIKLARAGEATLAARPSGSTLGYSAPEQLEGGPAIAAATCSRSAPCCGKRSRISACSTR